MKVVENMDGDHLRRIWRQGETDDGLKKKEKAKKVENKMRLMTDKTCLSRMSHQKERKSIRGILSREGIPT